MANNVAKWTSRGCGKCPSCSSEYSNAWKPKNCKACGYEVGGSYVPKTKKPRLESPDGCIRIVESSDVDLYSVKLNYRDNRTIVVKTKTDVVCHHDKCKENRAVHMASNTSFSCPHTDTLKSFSDPSSAKNMTNEDILIYKCDNATRNLLFGINPPQDFRHMVKISEHCFAVFTAPSTVNPTGYCHVHRQQAGHWLCSDDACNRKTGNSKQIKRKKICLHLHVLFCILKLSSPDLHVDIPKAVHAPSTSLCDVASTVYSSTSTSSETTSVSRISTIQLNLRRSIPYPVPRDFFKAHGNWPDCFVPQLNHCDLCGSALTAAQRHPGQGHNDLSYIVTPCSFRPVEVKVKFCTNKNCKAMHQVWPVEQGLFNISDKLLVALELLVQWRELFKRGVPLTVAVESSLAGWVKCGQVQVTGNECKYIVGLLYNGFYAFELLSNRCLDSVICGICGVVGHVYFGDGNEKNCCSIDAVDYQQQDNVSGDAEQLPSLEEFLGHLKSICVERVSYTTSLQDNMIKAAMVPPIIAPSMRAEQIFNTEMEKKSVYLGGKLFEKDKINGDPMLLHQIIKSKPLDMASLENMTIQELRGICRDCKIEKFAKLSKALLIGSIQALYSSLLTGASPCHGFTQVRGHTGGFYHMVCRHGTTVASKFLLLQESVRDAADLYLSLKYPPVLLVNDTPCGFARHLDLRVPEVTSQLWGDCLGCFEKPVLDQEPMKEVSVPEIVISEFSAHKLPVQETTGADHQHPLTQSSRRYIVGDRFHTSTNPHKSTLCEFHNINLCIQRDVIKTSYQESQNNSKNLKRLRSATMQSFPVHYLYNFLMDFYHNEGIVEKQKNSLTSSLKEGHKLMRDKYLRFTIVDN